MAPVVELKSADWGGGGHGGLNDDVFVSVQNSKIEPLPQSGAHTPLPQSGLVLSLDDVSGGEHSGSRRGSEVHGKEVAKRVKHMIESARRAGHDPGKGYITLRDLRCTIKTQADEGVKTLGGMFKKSRTTERKILDGITCGIKPGTLAVVMGSRGSGKTSFLKLLAGRLSKDIDVSGELLVDGGRPDGTLSSRRSGFVEAEDVHHPFMTVEETIRFAAKCRLPTTSDPHYVDNMVRDTLDILGLSHVAKNLVGNTQISQISGGQRRRVSIAQEFVANPQFLIMDEPSTGLDAPMTYDIAVASRAMASEGRTVVMSLLQPSPETFNLFDTVILFSEGRLVYFGPGGSSLESHFTRLGYTRPSYATLPDFVQSALEPASTDLPNECLPNGRALTKTELIAAYEAGPKREVDAAADAVRDEAARHRSSGAATRYDAEQAQGFLYAFLACIMREGTLWMRNKQQIQTRVFQALFTGFVSGTLFINLPKSFTGAVLRVSIAFLWASHLMFEPMGTIPRLFEERRVYYRQVKSGFFRPAAYYWARLLAESPIAFIEIVALTAISYWPVGFSAADNGQRYLTLIFVLWLVFNTSNGLTQAVAGAASTAVQGTAMAPAVLSFFLIFCGFLVPKELIPKPWIWMYYISFLVYPIEAIAINELHDLQLDGGGTGVLVLEFFTLRTTKDWVWPDIVILIGFMVFFCVLGFLAWAYLRYEEPQQSRADNDVAETVNVDDDPKATIDIKGMQASIAWRNLGYSIKVKKQGDKALLTDVTAYCKGGTLMALMGPSGAGKTTLLDVLANRKSMGKISGQLLVNGRPRDKFFARTAGYVEQFDLLLPEQTVREAIVFAALLRLPRNMTVDAKVQTADEVIDKLDLRKYADLMIGAAHSAELRKRVSIGIELVAKPAILFLDEPTSGLDAVAALNVMGIARRLAHEGHAVICTIHQPSAKLFELFDTLLLLRTGGRVAYFGPTGEHCQKVIGYFAEQGYTCPRGRNPADFVLEICQGKIHRDMAKSGGTDVDIAQLWDAAPLRAAQESAQVQFESPAQVDVDHFTSRYAAPFGSQLSLCVKRFFRTTYRRPQLIQAILTRALVLALIGGSMYYHNRTNNLAAGRMRVASAFFGIIAFGLGSIGTIGGKNFERSIMYRESSQGAYHPIAAFFSWYAVEGLLEAVEVVVFDVVFYFFAGLTVIENGGRFGFYIVGTLLFSQLMYAFNELAALAFPTAEMAAQIAVAAISPMAMFAGFIIPEPSIPRPWVWMHYISFLKYPLESLAANELQGLPLTCSENELQGCILQYGSGNVLGDQLIKEYGFSFDWRWRDAGIMAGFLVFMKVMSIIMVTKVRHLNK